MTECDALDAKPTQAIAPPAKKMFPTETTSGAAAAEKSRVGPRLSVQDQLIEERKQELKAWLDGISDED